jgi:gamma-glutamyltranspeptidase/glutathione hydrolase
MKKGGNAIDAAIATQFALRCGSPSSRQYWWWRFLVFRDKKGNTYTLDYREKAPEKASRDMYLDEKGNVKAGQPSWYGHLASGTPGAVDGLEQAHKRFGKLSWKQILQPAIDLPKMALLLLPVKLED